MFGSKNLRREPHMYLDMATSWKPNAPVGVGNNIHHHISVVMPTSVETWADNIRKAAEGEGGEIGFFVHTHKGDGQMDNVLIAFAGDPEQAHACLDDHLKADPGVVGFFCNLKSLKRIRLPFGLWLFLVAFFVKIYLVNSQVCKTIRPPGLFFNCEFQ
jgi:hypothetical protein